jgi:hypothetical protein
MPGGPRSLFLALFLDAVFLPVPGKDKPGGAGRREAVSG